MESLESGNIPAELGSLTRLGSLYLNNNQLSSNIPVELMNMTSLFDLSICYNHLYTSNPDLSDFLNSLQPDWENCQIMPFSIIGSVIHLHNSDGTLVYEFEVAIGDDFGGTLPDDIDTISIAGPSGELPFNKSDLTYWSQWKDFSLPMDGSPELGEYAFIVKSGDESSTAKDTQIVNRIISIVDSNTFFPPDEIRITTKTPTFSWQLVDFPETAIYYSLKIYKRQEQSLPFL